MVMDKTSSNTSPPAAAFRRAGSLAVTSAVVVLALVSLIATSCFVAPEPRVIRTVVEKEVEVPVEVVVEKEVVKEVEVPVEVVVEKEVIREVEVPVEVVVEKEVIREVEVPVEVVVEKEVVREVPVEVIVEKEVIKEVIVEKEVIREVLVEATPVPVPVEPSVPQVVRLVALVPSPGNVVLDDVGDSATLSVQGYYSDQTTADLEASLITYESTDPSVVSVSQDGVVTANGAGGADIIVGFGGFSRQVHALVFGDVPTLPPIDPDMVGVIPGLDVEVRAVLNRVIVELNPGYDTDDADDIAAEVGGEVVFSFSTFPGYVIEFDTQARELMDVLTQLDGDGRVEAAYPDVLFEELGHPIDTLSLKVNDESLSRAYFNAGFEGAWRMMERVPKLDPVIVSVVELGPMNVNGQNQHPIISVEFDNQRIHTPLAATTTDDHAAAVASVIAAVNHRLLPDSSHPNPSNFSGIITSVDDLEYDLIALSVDPQFLSLSDTLRQLGTINVIGQNIDVVNMSYIYKLIGWIENLSPIPFIENLIRPIPVIGDLLFGIVRTKNIIQDMPNVTFVPGAGNCQVDAAGYFPARLSIEPGISNVITVGGAATSYTERWTTNPPVCTGVRTNSSAYGEAVTIAAPAEQVWVVDINPRGSGSGYGFNSGTSFAAPMVTGSVALLRAIDPDATPEELKKLLVETGDEKTICTSTSTSPDTCPSSDEEQWSFLRTDKAVAKLLSDRIDATTTDRVTVPPDTQRVVGRQIDFGLPIVNTGEMAWPFYGEAILRAPNGSTSTRSAVNVIAPGGDHRFIWRFQPSANASGCWDMRVKVWMEQPVSSHLQKALSELNPNEDVRLLSDSGWMEEVLEVRFDPDQSEQ